MEPMAEDMKTFEARIARVDPDFKPSLLHKWRTRPKRTRRTPFVKTGMVLVFAYCTLTATKVVMERELGSAGFDAKVAQLAKGPDTAKFAAKLLWRDPVMAYVGARI
jgi:hypothetical protein